MTDDCSGWKPHYLRFIGVKRHLQKANYLHLHVQWQMWELKWNNDFTLIKCHVSKSVCVCLFINKNENMYRSKLKVHRDTKCILNGTEMKHPNMVWSDYCWREYRAYLLHVLCCTSSFRILHFCKLGISHFVSLYYWDLIM